MLNDRNYKAVLRLYHLTFDEDANWNFYESEKAWGDKKCIIAMFLFDETDIITLQRKIRSRSLL